MAKNKTRKQSSGRVTNTFNSLKSDNIVLTRDLYIAAGIIDKQQAEIKSKDDQIVRLKKRLQISNVEDLGEDE
tara:strand:+ start:435 stop:653 length:219 start_codon:yes stop_codon:yes gene_type:complete